MKILIIDNLTTDNEYVRILYHALKNIYETDVQFGVNALYSEYNFDVLHFQWPESIFDWETITNKDVNEFSRVLKSKNAKIVTTVHNLYPHHYKKSYQQLYKLLISNTDLFIHHCLNSKKIFLKHYSRIVKKSVQHQIIKHHLYQKKENLNPNLRLDLKIQDHEKVVLVLGNIRNYKESKLILNTFNILDIINKKLVVPRFCFNSIDIKFLRTISKWWNNLFISDKQKMILFSRKLNEEEIASYMEIADVLFIPRIDSLNSGLVYLGLTYEKKIVGPDYGCIGSTLFETLNYSFTPNSPTDAAVQLKNALLDSKPKQMDLDHYKIENIAPLYVKCYKSLLDN